MHDVGISLLTTAEYTCVMQADTPSGYTYLGVFDGHGALSQRVSSLTTCLAAKRADVSEQFCLHRWQRNF